MKHWMRQACALAALCCAMGAAAAADSQENFEVSAGNLLAVLRETPGANKQDEALQPFGPVTARLSDGRDFRFEPSWYQYLGDMHLRLVFDGDRHVQSAVPEDLQQLHLT